MSSEAHPNALPESSPNALAKGTRIRDYTIVSVIGIGGFSIVYKAMVHRVHRGPASFARGAIASQLVRAAVVAMERQRILEDPIPGLCLDR